MEVVDVGDQEKKIRVPEALYEMVEREAEEQNKTVGEVVEELVSRHIKKGEQKLPKCSFCGAELEEGLEYRHVYGSSSYLCCPCHELLGALVRDEILSLFKVLMGNDVREPRLKMRDFTEAAKDE